MPLAANRAHGVIGGVYWLWLPIPSHPRLMIDAVLLLRRKQKEETITQSVNSLGYTVNTTHTHAHTCTHMHTHAHTRFG